MHTWWNFCSEHLHGDDIDAENPDGTVQNIRAASEGYHADALALELPAICICHQFIRPRGVRAIENKTNNYKQVPQWGILNTRVVCACYSRK